jgi:hypothetical protein
MTPNAKTIALFGALLALSTFSSQASTIENRKGRKGDRHV